MKNYEEIAESVFKRSEEMIALNKRRRRDRLINIGTTVGCLAVAGAVGIGVWKNAGHGTDIVQPQIQNPAAAGSNSVESGTVPVTDHDTAYEAIEGASDNIVGVIPASELDPPDYPTLDDKTSSVGVTPASPAEAPVLSSDTPVWSENPSEVYIRDDDIVFPAIDQPDHQQPIASNGESVDTPNFNTVIENYAATTTRCYLSQPANGTFRYSDALIDAMENCGYTDENGDIQYRVVVNYYDNGQPVDVNSSAIREGEWNRLCGHGYHCEFETCGKDWGETTEHHFCMLLTRSQLESFTPCDSYGCTICLYGEKDCILYDDNASAPFQSVQTQPVQSQNGHHGNEHHNGDHC